MTFLQGSIDLFTGRISSHMGSYQYVEHKGMRNGESMSGAQLWAEIEASELNSDDTNLFSSEERLLERVAHDIHFIIQEGTPIIEMGTGTFNAFKKKTLRIMMALRSHEYICVDESTAFLQDLMSNEALTQFKVRPILDDFFESKTCYFDENERDGLVCMFGSTIGNIIAPLNNAPPQEALIQHLLMLAQAINRGYLLVSIDADKDGEKIKGFYTKQALFQLNTFFRMADELPISGDFDPYAFTYEADWNSSSGQLAHMAIVQKDMDFKIGNETIHLHEGQRLHMKNSFKFDVPFFKLCCEKAGLQTIKSWQDPSLTNVLLLKKISAAQEQPVYSQRKA